MKLFKVLFFCPLILCSCLPAKMPITPGLQGVVTDKDARSPIAGAMLQFETHKEFLTLTDNNGHYKLGPAKKWTFWVIMGVPVDFAPVKDIVVVTAAGYKKFISQSIVYGPYNDQLLLQNIQLEPDK